uniref:Odorant receptor 82 n=1 Tax=Chouioia cunea TaxID=1570515 RepID=A0A6B9CK49_9HYME|nr:odorant receptor 82 [Chouioia cunea]
MENSKAVEHLKTLETLMIKAMEGNRSNYNKDDLEKLLRSSDPDDEQRLKTTIIDILECDDIVAIKILIANQAIDLFSRDFEEKTALSVAVSSGSMDIVKLFLNQMNEYDVIRYNNEQLLCFDFPKILPELYLVEDIIWIVRILMSKKFLLSLKHKLAVLEFLVHDRNDCDCATGDIKQRLAGLIMYGSATHVKEIINKIMGQIDTGEIELDKEAMITCIRNALKPGVVFDLYIDKDIEDYITSIFPTWKSTFSDEPDDTTEYNWLKEYDIEDENTKLSLFDILCMNPRDTYSYISHLNFHQITTQHASAGEYIKSLKAKSLIRRQIEEFVPEFMIDFFPQLPENCANLVIHYIQCDLNNENILNMCRIAFAELRKNCDMVESYQEYVIDMEIDRY